MNATEVTTNVYEIPAENMGKLEAAIAKLDRRAHRLGLDSGISMVASDEQVRVVKGKAGQADQVFRFFAVTVTGTAPVVPGFAFVGTLEHTEGGTIVRTVPGVTAEGELAAFRGDSAPICQHCNMRRNRIDTFVIRETETGLLKQIGRNCLGMYLGAATPDELASAATLLQDLDEACRGYSGGGSGEELYTIEDVLAMTAACIRRLGWLSKARAEEFEKIPTVSYVRSAFTDNQEHGCSTDKGACGRPSWRNAPRGTKGCDWVDVGGHVGVTEHDTALAGDVLAWVRGIELVDGTSDYIYNLVTACKAEYIPSRRYGIVCSAVAAYTREQDRIAGIEKEKAVRVVSQFVGKVGDKLSLSNVTVLSSSAHDTPFGISYLHLFLTEDGNVLKWFTGSVCLEKGKVVTLKGTVKGHETYRDSNQTVMTRCKVA